MRAIALATAVFACTSNIAAQQPAQPIDAAAVARFADEFFAREMTPRQIPGAVFVFVSAGGIAVARRILHNGDRHGPVPDCAPSRGSLPGPRILRPDTVALMHAQHFAQSPGMSGWAYGLWEDTRNGHRALLHNGGGKGYRALMYLLPEQDAGFFVAYNLADRHEQGELQEAFITRFRERFLAGSRSVDVAAAESRSLERLVGEYLYVRRARTTEERFISVVNRVRVRMNENGALNLTGSSREAVDLMPAGPLAFRRSDGRGIIAFEQPNESGQQRLLMTMDSGLPAVYERVSLGARLPVQVGWLASMVLVFLYAAVWRPLTSLWRRTSRVDVWDERRRSRWLGSTGSALNLVFLVGFPMAFVGRIEGGLPAFVYGVPVVARALLLVPTVTGILAVAALIAVVADVRSRLTPPPRWADSLVAAALLSFVTFAWYWNLMPWAAVLGR